jgi:hypothetical protein
MRSLTASLLIAVLVTVGLGGCFRHRIIVDDRPAQTSLISLDVDRYFVLGIVRIGGDLPVNGYCQTGVARIEQRAGIIHVLVSALTFGVITSRSSSYSCLPASLDTHETGPQPPATGTGAPTR